MQFSEDAIERFAKTLKSVFTYRDEKFMLGKSSR